MSADSWKRVKELFEAAQLHPPEERSRWLAEACDDPDIRKEVESLLASHDRAGAFIQTPPATEALGAIASLAAGVRRGELAGAWRLVEEIGRGGMGTVWLAERADGAFEQKAALKLVSRGLETEAILQRFHQERQILASLNHPNITALLDGGTTADGAPYFVMQHVEGSPITEFCRKHDLPLREKLKLFCTVCETVEYAHRSRVLHRDLKPSNILVTGEGVVKLLDFGIAKLLTAQPGEAATLTMGPLQILTPEYASPEQVRGEPLAEPTDVYALGVVLYELVAGRRPYEFQSRSPQEIVSIVCEREPAKPSAAARRPELKGDLDSIAGMALRKEPQFRYRSAGELAADVRRYLEGRPVLAVRPTIRYRARKLLRRHGAAVAAAMVLVILAALMVWQNLRRANPAQSDYRRSTIAAANEYYERALAVEKSDLTEERILALYQHAVELDPNFTAARRRLGFYQLAMVDHGLSGDAQWLDRAEVELTRAQREEPNVAAIHSFLSVLSYYRREWDQMEMHGRRAVRLDPRDMDAAMSLVPLYRLRDDYPQAMRLSRQALQSDPAFVLARINLADAYRLSGDPARCIREIEGIPEPERFLPVVVILTTAFLDRGETAKARQTLDRTRADDRRNYYYRLANALVNACEGKSEEARREVDSGLIGWVNLIPEGPSLAAEIASVDGDTDAALSWLEKGIRGGDHRRSWFLLDPQLANVRKHPRFRQILGSIPAR